MLTAVSQIFVIFLFLVLGVLLYLYMERSGLTPPAKSDQVFSLVAVDGGLPLVVGILFVVGLISSTYSAAGSALTALTPLRSIFSKARNAAARSVSRVFAKGFIY